MKLVTVATHSERYFPVLRASAERHDYELVVLGWGEAWEGFTKRLRQLLQYLAGVSPEEVIIIADAYDVVVLQPSAVALQRFQADELSSQTRQTKVIMGWERANSWLIERLSYMVFGACQGKRMNAGAYIGRCKDIRRVLTAACAHFDCADAKDTNDQVLLTKYCQQQPEHFQLDVNFRYFLVVNGALSHFDKRKNEVTITPERELVYKGRHRPCLIHAIGATNINDLISELGYDNPTPLTLRDVLKYDVQYAWHYAFYLWPQLLLVLLAGAACVFALIVLVRRAFFQRRRYPGKAKKERSRSRSVSL